MQVSSGSHRRRTCTHIHVHMYMHHKSHNLHTVASRDALSVRDCQFSQASTPTWMHLEVGGEPKVVAPREHPIGVDAAATRRRVRQAPPSLHRGRAPVHPAHRPHVFAYSSLPRQPHQKQEGGACQGCEGGGSESAANSKRGTFVVISLDRGK